MKITDTAKSLITDIEEATADASNAEITHLGVTAPLAIWELLGYRKSLTRDDAPVEARTVYTGGDRKANASLDALVVRGSASTGATDQTAIAWAIGEATRQKEEATRIRSIRSEAEAISSLARAIRENGEKATLERILSQLTERTQYAVRAQLRR